MTSTLHKLATGYSGPNLKLTRKIFPCFLHSRYQELLCRQLRRGELLIISSKSASCIQPCWSNRIDVTLDAIVAFLECSYKLPSDHLIGLLNSVEFHIWYCNFMYLFYTHTADPFHSFQSTNYLPSHPDSLSLFYSEKSAPPRNINPHDIEKYIKSRHKSTYQS